MSEGKKIINTSLREVPESLRQVRFAPDDNTTGQISFQPHSDLDSFKAELTGLVLNESYGGLCLVVLLTAPMALGPCLVHYSGYRPMKANIRWYKQIDEQIYKIGLELADS